VPGTTGRVAPSTNNPDVVSAGKEDVADMKKNAIITQEHSQVLRPNSFQSILSATRKFLAKARRVSSKIWAVVLEIKLFSVKQPSNRDDKSVALSSGQKKRNKISFT
jgi:hypothetical protein